MRKASHRSLGQYLVQSYMSTLPPRHIYAFLTGCVQPDLNPTTYLKGSLRYQWLRGHNYDNAERLMGRIARGLEKKSKLNWMDYYSLGKLIHYTADAFTSCHNAHFSEDLCQHRIYEAQLQRYFLKYLMRNPIAEEKISENIMDTIARYHNFYITLPAHVHTDSVYVVNACSSVMAILLQKTITPYPYMEC